MLHVLGHAHTAQSLRQRTLAWNEVIYEVGISWQSGGIPVRTSGGGGRLEGGSDTYAARLQIALTGWFLELQPEALAVIQLLISSSGHHVSLHFIHCTTESPTELESPTSASFQ